MMDGLDLAALLSNCLDRNDDCLWEEFVSKAQPIIAAAIIRSISGWMSPTVQQVDDIIQEVFLKLCEDDFRVLRNCTNANSEGVAGYLRRIAATVAIDSIRSGAAKKRGGGKAAASIDDLPIMAPPEADPAFQTERRLLMHRIDRCLETYPSRDRSVFWMYYRQGFTTAMISKLPQLELTAKGVESAIYRLTKSVRNCLKIRVASGLAAS